MVHLVILIEDSSLVHIGTLKWSFLDDITFSHWWINDTLKLFFLIYVLSSYLLTLLRCHLNCSFDESLLNYWLWWCHPYIGWLWWYHHWIGWFGDNEYNELTDWFIILLTQFQNISKVMRLSIDWFDSIWFTLYKCWFELIFSPTNSNLTINQSN